MSSKRSPYNWHLDLNDGLAQGRNFTDAHAHADPSIVGRWQKVTAVFTTAPATTGLHVRIVKDGGGSGTFFVDEVSITLETRASSLTLIPFLLFVCSSIHSPSRITPLSEGRW